MCTFSPLSGHQCTDVTFYSKSLVAAFDEQLLSVKAIAISPCFGVLNSIIFHSRWFRERSICFMSTTVSLVPPSKPNDPNECGLCGTFSA